MSRFVRITQATVISLDQVARVSFTQPSGTSEWRAVFEAVVGGSNAFIPLVTLGGFASTEEAAERVQDILSGSYAWQPSTP
jgi:hypothetical protein